MLGPTMTANTPLGNSINPKLDISCLATIMRPRTYPDVGLADEDPSFGTVCFLDSKKMDPTLRNLRSHIVQETTGRFVHMLRKLFNLFPDIERTQLAHETLQQQQ